ncbi:MAG: GreA/GreB family elongation factor, partial [Arenicellales bacterium]
MSRAFVKESEPDAPIELPERPVSSLRNLMTPEGYESMRSLYQGLQDELDQLRGIEEIAARNRRAELQRDIRYYAIRLQSAEVVECPIADTVRFGHRVSFTDDNKKNYYFQIVGEDEVDAARQKISWASPLAKILIGQQVGDICCWHK